MNDILGLIKGDNEFDIVVTKFTLFLKVFERRKIFYGNRNHAVNSEAIA